MIHVSAYEKEINPYVLYRSEDQKKCQYYVIHAQSAMGITNEKYFGIYS